MARPQVADGGDGLQIWSVAVDYWINSRWLPTRGGPPTWRLGAGLTNSRRKKKLVTKDHKKLRTWKDSLDKRPKQKKMDMRFGTWNVRSTYV
jgi:hypothetical protein